MLFRSNYVRSTTPNCVCKVTLSNSIYYNFYNFSIIFLIEFIKKLKQYTIQSLLE